MLRLNLTLDKSKVVWVYKNNALVVSYPKPDSVLMREAQMRQEFDKLNAKNPKEGEIECVT